MIKKFSVTFLLLQLLSLLLLSQLLPAFFFPDSAAESPFPSTTWCYSLLFFYFCGLLCLPPPFSFIPNPYCCCLFCSPPSSSSTADTIPFPSYFIVSLAYLIGEHIEIGILSCLPVNSPIIHRSIGYHIKKPYEIFYSVRHRQSIDYIPIAEHYRAFEFKFVAHVYELHKKISDKIVQNNANCKLRTDVRRLKNFILVMLKSCTLVVMIHFKYLRN